MGTNECSQPASKSSWDSQDFGDISMVFKMAHFRKSTGPRWVKEAAPHTSIHNINYGQIKQLCRVESESFIDIFFVSCRTPIPLEFKSRYSLHLHNAFSLKLFLKLKTMLLVASFLTFKDSLLTSIQCDNLHNASFIALIRITFLACTKTSSANDRVNKIEDIL